MVGRLTRLRIEPLERRDLLTTIEILASGTTGEEEFELIIDEAVVSEFALSGIEQEVFSYQSGATVTADQIKLRFTNDLFDSTTGLDRNLIVDRLVLDGKSFETEHPSTFSTGSWTPDYSAAVPGYRQTDWLQTNGYFEFANQGATTISVFARGTTGEEQMQLIVNGKTYGDFTVSLNNQAYTIQLDEVVSPLTDDFRVAFSNDFYDPANQVDRNLIVDRIQVNEQTFETEALDTFSTGTWTPENGIAPGYFQNEWLHGNGYFQFASPSSTVAINAWGDVGSESFTLNIDGIDVATFDVTTQLDQYTYDHFGPLTPNDVRIQYSGDVYDPANGIDTNLNVPSIEVDGIALATDSPFVFSTGTWTSKDQSIVPGYGRGITLNSNGYLQYATGSTISFRAQGGTGLEDVELIVAGKRVQQFELEPSFAELTFVSDGFVSANQVRLEYASDNGTVDQPDNRSVTVDWLQIDGVRYETEDSSTYSAGTNQVGQRVEHGFGNGETLLFNGFFQYQGVLMNADEFSVPEDGQAIPLAVLVNDVKSESNTIAIAEFTQPANGNVTLADGILRYSPAPDFVGTDTFTYGIESNNGSRQLVPATVSISVNESHQQPQTLLNPKVAPELMPSGRFLEVERLVQLPVDEGGRQPRMNSMATLGDRVFVVTDGRVNGAGEIYELVTDASGTTSAELFLDVGAAVFASTGLNINNSNPLFGLRGMAFHPEFASNGKFYITYTGDRPADPSQFFYLSDPANPVAVESVLAEWTYDFDTNAVDTASYREVFRVGMIALDHPIRQPVFNPFAVPGDEDYGLLYIGHGDASEQSAIAGDGQNNDALGKILRIDPLATIDAPYSVPTTNPLVGDPNFPDEVYAYGFRNPHNLTFARDGSGQVQLIATEIGRDNVEEVNLVDAGKNYGWADREGVFVHLRDQFGINGNIANLPANDAENDYVYPVSILGHEGVPGESFVGQAIAGGHVIQNGSSELDDQFILVEFATDGRAYHVDFSDMLQQVTTLDPADPFRDSPDALTWLTPQELTILYDHDGDDSTTPLVRDSLKDVLDDAPSFEAVLSAGLTRADLRLGQGPNGELYILNKRNGWVYVATNTVPSAQASTTQDPPTQNLLAATRNNGVGESENLSNEENLSANPKIDSATPLITMLDAAWNFGAGSENEKTDPEQYSQLVASNTEVRTLYVDVAQSASAATVESTRPKSDERVTDSESETWDRAIVELLYVDLSPGI